MTTFQNKTQDRKINRTNLVAKVFFLLLFLTVSFACSPEENNMDVKVLPMKTQLKVMDVDASKKFYQDVFSMEVVEEWNEQNDRGVILRRGHTAGGGLLELYQVSDSHDFNGTSLQFEVTSADKFLSSLPEGITFEGPALRPWGATYIYLKDPSGVDIIVYKAAK